MTDRKYVDGMHRWAHLTDLHFHGQSETSARHCQRRHLGLFAMYIQESMPGVSLRNVRLEEGHGHSVSRSEAQDSVPLTTFFHARFRQPKMVVNDRVERAPRSKRKNDEDYSSDASSTDDTDLQEDDEDDEEFQHDERKNNPAPNHHTRRVMQHDHLNESISSPASSTTTTRSYRSVSPSSSSRVHDPSKPSAMKTRTTIASMSRSNKSASSLSTSRKSLNDNDRKKSNPSTKSKEAKRPSNENNQKLKATISERNRKNLSQNKK